MRTDDVVKHFKDKTRVAAALNITVAAVSQWGDTPPPLRQLQLQAITNGVLVAEKAVYGETTVQAA